MFLGIAHAVTRYLYEESVTPRSKAALAATATVLAAGITVGSAKMTIQNARTARDDFERYRSEREEIASLHEVA